MTLEVSGLEQNDQPVAAGEVLDGELATAQAVPELDAAVSGSIGAREALRGEVTAEAYPSIPEHAVRFLESRCTAEQLPFALQEAAQLDPALLEDPVVAEFELEACISAAEIAARTERVEQRQDENATLVAETDAEQQANVERRTTVNGLRERISGNLTGDNKLGQLDQLITDVRGAEGFSAAERAAALQQLQMIRGTLAAMGNVMTSERSSAAFQRIVAGSSLNLGAGSLATTFAPVMAQVEASPEISASEKQRLRSIVTGSDAQAALAETIVDENGVTRPRYTRDAPRELRDGVTGYATENGRQILDLRPGDHPIEMDITGWRGEDVGQLIEVMTVAYDFEAAGLTGYLKSIYDYDFNMIGDAGLTPDEVDRMHQMIDHILGGLETSDGDIIRSGERRGYLRFFARLHNPSGTATGFENSQQQTEQVARDLRYKNKDGSINWNVLRTIGQFARTNYMSGDPNYEDLEAYVQRQHPKLFGEAAAETPSEN